MKEDSDLRGSSKLAEYEHKSKPMIMLSLNLCVPCVHFHIDSRSTAYFDLVYVQEYPVVPS